MSQDIWKWWVSNHDVIPENVKQYRDYLMVNTESLDEVEEFMFDYKYATDDYFVNRNVVPSKTVKANPIAEDIAMRRGLKYAARRILPRAVPYVGWGLLAKDIYDFFKD